MLIDVLRELINNLFKESFYMKKKKKTINILTVFSFLIKVMLKFFLNKLLTNVLKTFVSITLIFIIIIIIIDKNTLEIGILVAVWAGKLIDLLTKENEQQNYWIS